MNVARALLDGLGDHPVYQPDHRRLTRHVAEMLEVFAGETAFSLHVAVGLRAGVTVVTIDGVDDFLFSR